MDKTEDLIKSIKAKIKKENGEKYLGNIALLGWDYSKFKKKFLYDLSEEQLNFLNTLSEESLKEKVEEIINDIGAESFIYDLELVIDDGEISIDLEFKKDGNFESGLFSVI